MAALQGRNTSLGLFSCPCPRRSPGQCGGCRSTAWRRHPPPSSALLCSFRTRRFCSEWDICQARGLWGAGTATEAVLGVSLQKDCSHGSSPAQPCQASGSCLRPGLWAEQKFSWFC